MMCCVLKVYSRVDDMPFSSNPAAIPAPVTDLLTAQDTSQGFRSQAPVLSFYPATSSVCGPAKSGIPDAAAGGLQPAGMLPFSATSRSEAQKKSPISVPATPMYDHLAISGTVTSKYSPLDLHRKFEEERIRKTRRDRRQKQRMKAAAARHDRKVGVLHDEGQESNIAVLNRKAEHLDNVRIDGMQVSAKDQTYFNSKKVHQQTVSASVPLSPKTWLAHHDKYARHEKSHETGMARGGMSKNLSGARVLMQYGSEQPSKAEHAQEREHGVVDRSTCGRTRELAHTQSWAETRKDQGIRLDEEHAKVVGETEHVDRAPGRLSSSPTHARQEEIVRMAAKDRDDPQIEASPIPTVVTSRSGCGQNRGVSVIERNLKPVLLTWRDVVGDLTRVPCLQSGAPPVSAEAARGCDGTQHVQVDSEQDQNNKSDELANVGSSELVTLEKTSSVSGYSESTFKHSPTAFKQSYKPRHRCLKEVLMDLGQNEQSDTGIFLSLPQEPGNEFTHDTQCQVKEEGNGVSETREKQASAQQNLILSPARIQEFQSIVKGSQKFKPKVAVSSQCEPQVIKQQDSDITVGQDALQVHMHTEVVSDTNQSDSTSINLSFQKTSVETKEPQSDTDLSQHTEEIKNESEMVKRRNLASVFDQEQQEPSETVDLYLDEDKLLGTPEQEQESEEMDVDMDVQDERLCLTASDVNDTHLKIPAVPGEAIASRDVVSPTQICDQQLSISYVQDKAVDEVHHMSGEASENSVLSFNKTENQSSSFGSYLLDHNISCDASASSIASSACKANMSRASTGKETESSPHSEACDDLSYKSSSCETSVTSVSVSAGQRCSQEVAKSNVNPDSAKIPLYLNLQHKTKQAGSGKSSSSSLFVDLQGLISTSSPTDCGLSSPVQETICTKKPVQGDQVVKVDQVEKVGLNPEASCHMRPAVGRVTANHDASFSKRLCVQLEPLSPSVLSDSSHRKQSMKEIEHSDESGRTEKDVSRRDQYNALDNQLATSISPCSRNVHKSPSERLKGKAAAGIHWTPAASKRRADPERIDFFDDSYDGASSASGSDSSDDELSEGLESLPQTSSSVDYLCCDSPDVQDKSKSSVTENKIAAPKSISTVQSAGQCSLDDLLKELKDTEGVQSEILALQEELHKGILLGGFEVVGENECTSDDDGLTVEHLKALEQLEMTTRLIPDVHPAEAVLHVTGCGRLFTEALSPLKCGYSPSGSGSLEKLLVNLQPEFIPDLICSGIISMCKMESAACKNALMRWLFFLSSVHSNGKVALKCVQEIAEMIQWHLEHNAHKKARYYTWSPDVSDVLHVLVNWGARQEELVFDRNVIGNVDQLSEVLDVSDTLPKPRVTYQNIEAVLRVLSSCLQARPRYSSEELSQLLLMVCKLALDPLLSNQSLQYEIQVCLSSIVECYAQNQWHKIMPSLSRQLARLASHHHSQVYLAQHLGFSCRSRQLQQLMAFFLLREALPSGDGDGDHDEIEDKNSFQVSDLTKLLQRMKSLVHGDHYLLYSLVQLLDICVGPVDLRLSQKKQLHELAETLQGVISEIKDNLRMMDIAKVKDMMLCMRSKWHLTLKCASERQRSLFSCWSNPEVPTNMMEKRVEATSLDNESDEDASEEKSGNRAGTESDMEISPKRPSSVNSSAALASTGPSKNGAVSMGGREMDWRCESGAKNGKDIQGSHPHLSCHENYEDDTLPELYKA